MDFHAGLQYAGVMSNCPKPPNPSACNADFSAYARLESRSDFPRPLFLAVAVPVAGWLRRWGEGRRSAPRRKRLALSAVLERQPTAQTGFQPLLDWLNVVGARGLGNVITADSEFAGAGTGVFAARDLAIGEAFFTVPHDVCLAAEDGPLGMGAELAAALLREKRLGDASPFAQFISSLPSARELSCHPLLWSEGARYHKLLVACPQTQRMVRHMQMRGAAEADELVATGAAETRKEACWALAVVESRAVTLGDGSPGSPMRLALCPLVDLLNHDVPLGGEPSTCRFSDMPDQGCVALITERPVRSSEELCLVYEECSTAQMFARYGFIQRASEADTCLLHVPIGDPKLPGGPEARAMRLHLVRQAWRRSVWRELLLKMPNHAGPGGALLEVARLAVLPSVEMVRQAGVQILNGARLNVELEAAAVAQAKQWVQDAVERIDKTLLVIRDSDATPATSDDISNAVVALLEVDRGVLLRSLTSLAAAERCS